MRLLTFGARNFRNLEPFEIEPHPRFNVFEGDNAQGKTNLLEAAVILGALKSFRATRTDLIRFEAEEAVVEARIANQGLEHEVRVVLGQRGRHVWLDGRHVRRINDYLGTLPLVLFAPEDVSLLKGPPSDRRTFLDRAVFNSRAAYLEHLGDYNAVLKQRNALLRDEHPRLDLLDIYDVQLVQHGARVLASRLSYLELFEPTFKVAFGDIFGRDIDVVLRYQPSWMDDVANLTTPRVEHVAERLEAALVASRRADIRRGQTLVGPHRDDLMVELDGRSARVHASQGQHRALVLALKTNEITLLRDHFEREPILLLDDVSSELDQARNAALFEFLSEFTGQVFITTTSRSHIQLSGDHRTWRVEAGTLIG